MYIDSESELRKIGSHAKKIVLSSRRCVMAKFRLNSASFDVALTAKKSNLLKNLQKKTLREN